MARDEVVNVRKRGSDALLNRLVPDLAAVRVRPDHAVGDGDELTPPPLSEEIAAGIAGSRLVVVADCGHLSTMERPDAVNGALLEWMAR